MSPDPVDPQADAPASPGRLPSLDGLRALSIVMVLLSHVIGTQGFPLHTLPVRIGELGVRIFFVISGFLITSLLLAELARDRDISLLKFYYRRAFRIFPAFYVMVAVVAALAAAEVVVLRQYDLLAAVTYTTNFHPLRAYNLNHLWSLAVEEQFYLLWPAALMLLGRTRGLVLAAVLVVLVPILREATVRGFIPGATTVGESFHTVADSLAVGCVLAGVRGQLSAWRPYQWLARSPLMLAVPALIMASSVTERWPLLDLLVQPASNIAIALVILWTVEHAHTPIGRVLNWRPIAYVGTLSYSLYLWQQLFLNPKSTATFTHFPLNLGLAIVAGVGSYYLVERPMLRLRERLEPRLFARRTEQPAGAA